MDKVAVDKARYAALLTPAGQDPVRLHRRGGRWRTRRRLPPRCPARARGRPRQAARLLQAARQGDGGKHLGDARRGRRLGRGPRHGSERRRLCRPAPPGARRQDHRVPRTDCETLATGPGGELSRAPDRARRARGRQGLRLWRRLPARSRHGPARRRRFRQGLLCRPGGRVAHAASRHGAHAHRADRVPRRRLAARGHRGDGRRQGRRAHRLRRAGRPGARHACGSTGSRTPWPAAARWKQAAWPSISSSPDFARFAFPGDAAKSGP